MLVQQMSIPGHGDSDSSEKYTSTRLPDAELQDLSMDLELSAPSVAKMQKKHVPQTRLVCLAKAAKKVVASQAESNILTGSISRLSGFYEQINWLS